MAVQVPARGGVGGVLMEAFLGTAVLHKFKFFYFVFGRFMEKVYLCCL